MQNKEKRRIKNKENRQAIYYFQELRAEDMPDGVAETHEYGLNHIKMTRQDKKNKAFFPLRQKAKEREFQRIKETQLKTSMHRSQLPPGTKILWSFWVETWKTNIVGEEAKARFTIDGSGEAK